MLSKEKSNSRLKNGRFVKKKLFDRTKSALSAMEQGKKEILEKRNNNKVQGTHVVDLDFLGENLRCGRCQNILSLENIIDEQRKGVYSILTITCDLCKANTKVGTNQNENSESEINSSFVLGTREVDLNLLGNNLHCIQCQNILCLKNIIHELRIGANSVLTLTCILCKGLTKVEINNNQIKPSEVDSSFVVGAVHSSVGNTGLNKILACANLPPISNNLYKWYEKMGGTVIEKEAKRSCLEAAIEERRQIIEKVKELQKEL